MTAADLSFRAPATLAEALAALAGDEEAIALGGGTSVALLLKHGLIEPRRLVWLGRVGGLGDLQARPDGSLAIGATVTLRELAGSAAVRRLAPALAEAAGQVGNPRVRAVATVGGALAHADPRQDLPPALLALAATARIAGPAGERELPLAGFYTGFMETVLAPGELVTQVIVPSGPGRRSAYLRFTPASEGDFPVIGAAASIMRGADGLVTGAALALAGAGPVPLLIPAARELAGHVPAAADIEAVAAAAAAAARPVSDQRGSARYKQAMAAEWTRRALRACLSDTGPAGS
ncbi:MAG TPA: FAD binding domain-containing protein [Streptosporangiaceae bacterium]|nr:FAD binding domain-containing protein [Streptosporangiaceae bacterium]